MKHLKSIVLVAVLLVLATASSVFADGHEREDLPTIVDIAVASDDFNTLVSLVTSSGLAGALSDNDTMLTVFAPTDAAFAKVPQATLDALAADADLLRSVLLYHVVSGDIGSDLAIAAAASNGGAASLQGEMIGMKVYDGTLFLNDETKVTAADLLASNGKIHVIDRVLLPPSIANAAASDGGDSATTATAVATGNTIVDLAIADGRFDTLVELVVLAGLADDLQSAGPFTVFAPTDAAFAKLPAATVAALKADPKGALANILLYHVVSGEVGSDTAATLTSATALSGETINIKVYDGNIYLNDDSKVIVADVLASNGKIHAIDTVILPPTGE